MRLPPPIRFGAVDPRVSLSRAAVIRTAADLFVEGGPSAITIDAIVARSGVAKSTIHRHWGSRDEVLLAVVESCAPQIAAPDPETDVETALRDTVKAVAGFVRDPHWSRMLPALLMLKQHEATLADLEPRIERTHTSLSPGACSRRASTSRRRIAFLVGPAPRRPPHREGEVRRRLRRPRRRPLPRRLPLTVAPKAGWYSDPTLRQAHRWWDGEQWTSHVATFEGQQLDENQPAAPAAAPTTATTLERQQPVATGPLDHESIRSLTERARQIRDTCKKVLEARRQRRLEAGGLIGAMRDEVVRAQMATMPISKLREVEDGMRLGALETAGYRTVDQVAMAGIARLDSLPGVGPTTASRLMQAVASLESVLRRDVRLSFDVDARPKSQSQALSALHSVDVADRAIGPIEDQVAELARAIDALLPPAMRGANKLRSFFSGKAKKEQAQLAAGQLAAQLQASGELVARVDAALRALEGDRTPLDQVWADYERRSVAYNELLAEIGGLAPPVEAVHGFLPNDVVAAVEAQPLDTSLLKTSAPRLPGVRREVRAGAAAGRSSATRWASARRSRRSPSMCHLARPTARRTSWSCARRACSSTGPARSRGTRAEARRLHGGERARPPSRVGRRRRGRRSRRSRRCRLGATPQGLDLGLMVVDEAHYVKNPAPAHEGGLSWIPAARRRAMFLTGTPMENRVTSSACWSATSARRRRGPALVDGAGRHASSGPAVAPVYLRRNQEDVLSELPPRMETQEWLPLTAPTSTPTGRRLPRETSWRCAGRRTPRAPSRDRRSSAGWWRSSARPWHGRKVVVFSYFRDVLETVTTDARPAGRRPADRRRPADGPPGDGRRVHCHQACGTGLPDPGGRRGPEHPGRVGDDPRRAAVDAVDRGAGDRPRHRMGQVRPVDVHRLLSEDSVDEHMRQVLAGKSALIAEYAKKSDMKEASAAAVDAEVIEGLPEPVSQPTAEQAIIAAEVQRLGVAQSERPTG